MAERPFDLAKLDVDGIRLARRKRWFLYSSPILVILFGTGSKLVSTSVFALLGVHFISLHQPANAEPLFVANTIVNVIETYKSDFNIGTTELYLNKLDAADGHLTQALHTAPTAKICIVRTNLSIVYELQADALSNQKKLDDAIILYNKARETIVGDNCTKDPGDNPGLDAKNGNDIDKPQLRKRGLTIQQRVESKLISTKKARNNESNEAPDRGDSENQQKNGDTSKPSDESMKKLQQQQRNAEVKRRSQQQYSQDSRDYEKQVPDYSSDTQRW